MPRLRPPPPTEDPLLEYDPKRLEALNRDVDLALRGVAHAYGLRYRRVVGATCYRHGVGIQIFFPFDKDAE